MNLYFVTLFSLTFGFFNNARLPSIGNFYRVNPIAAGHFFNPMNGMFETNDAVF